MSDQVNIFRRQLTNQLISRGFSTVDELMTATYGEWPPKGLEITEQNDHQIKFVPLTDMMNVEGKPFLTRLMMQREQLNKVGGRATIEGERTIGINNRDLRLNWSGNIKGVKDVNKDLMSLMGHEVAHSIQGDHTYRADDVFGMVGKDITKARLSDSKDEGVREFFAANQRPGLVDKAPTPTKIQKHLGITPVHLGTSYFQKGIEIQARIQEVMIAGYQEWGRLPQNKEELLVALADSGLRLPNELMGQLNRSPTIEQTRAVFSNKLNGGHTVRHPVNGLSTAMNSLTEQGKSEFVNKILVASYADLIEMYGDKQGRQRFGLGNNPFPSLRPLAKGVLSSRNTEDPQTLRQRDKEVLAQYAEADNADSQHMYRDFTEAQQRDIFRKAAEGEGNLRLFSPDNKAVIGISGDFKELQAAASMIQMSTGQAVEISFVETPDGLKNPRILIDATTIDVISLKNLASVLPPEFDITKLPNQPPPQQLQTIARSSASGPQSGATLESQKLQQQDQTLVARVEQNLQEGKGVTKEQVAQYYEAQVRESYRRANTAGRVYSNDGNNVFSVSASRAELLELKYALQQTVPDLKVNLSTERSRSGEFEKPTIRIDRISINYSTEEALFKILPKEIRPEILPVYIGSEPRNPESLARVVAQMTPENRAAYEDQKLINEVERANSQNKSPADQKPYERAKLREIFRKAARAAGETTLFDAGENKLGVVGSKENRRIHLILNRVEKATGVKPDAQTVVIAGEEHQVFVIDADAKGLTPQQRQALREIIPLGLDMAALPKEPQSVFKPMVRPSTRERPESDADIDPRAMLRRPGAVLERERPVKGISKTYKIPDMPQQEELLFLQLRGDDQADRARQLSDAVLRETNAVYRGEDGNFIVNKDYAVNERTYLELAALKPEALQAMGAQFEDAVKTITSQIIEANPELQSLRYNADSAYESGEILKNLLSGLNPADIQYNLDVDKARADRLEAAGENAGKLQPEDAPGNAKQRLIEGALREDLGFDASPETLEMIQKQLVEQAIATGKLVPDDLVVNALMPGQIDPVEAMRELMLAEGYREIAPGQFQCDNQVLQLANYEPVRRMQEDAEGILMLQSFNEEEATRLTVKYGAKRNPSITNADAAEILLGAMGLDDPARAIKGYNEANIEVSTDPTDPNHTANIQQLKELLEANTKLGNVFEVTESKGRIRFSVPGAKEADGVKRKAGLQVLLDQAPDFIVRVPDFGSSIQDLAMLDPEIARNVQTRSILQQAGVTESPTLTRAQAATVLLDAFGLRSETEYLAALEKGTLDLTVDRSKPDFENSQKILKAYKALEQAKQKGEYLGELPMLTQDGDNVTLRLPEGIAGENKVAMRTRALSWLLEHAGNYKTSAMAASTLGTLNNARAEFRLKTDFYDAISDLMRQDAIDPLIKVSRSADMGDVQQLSDFLEAAQKVQEAQIKLKDESRQIDPGERTQLIKQQEDGERAMAKIRSDTEKMLETKTQVAEIHTLRMQEHVTNTVASRRLNVTSIISGYRALLQINNDPTISGTERVIRNTVASSQIIAGGAGTIIDTYTKSRPSSLLGLKFGTKASYLGVVTSAHEFGHAFTIEGDDLRKYTGIAGGAGNLFISSVAAVGARMSLTAAIAETTSVVGSQLVKSALRANVIIAPVAVGATVTQAFAADRVERQDISNEVQNATFRSIGDGGTSLTFVDIPGLKPKSTDYKQLPALLKEVKALNLTYDTGKPVDLETHLGNPAELKRLALEVGVGQREVANSIYKHQFDGTFTTSSVDSTWVGWAVSQTLKATGISDRDDKVRQLEDRMNAASAISYRALRAHQEITGDLPGGRRNYETRYAEYEKVIKPLEKEYAPQIAELEKLRDITLAVVLPEKREVYMAGLGMDAERFNRYNTAMREAENADTRRMQQASMLIIEDDPEKIRQFLGMSKEEFLKRDTPNSRSARDIAISGTDKEFTTLLDDHVRNTSAVPGTVIEQIAKFNFDQEMKRVEPMLERDGVKLASIGNTTTALEETQQMMALQLAAGNDPQQKSAANEAFRQSSEKLLNQLDIMQEALNIPPDRRPRAREVMRQALEADREEMTAGRPPENAANFVDNLRTIYYKGEAEEYFRMNAEFIRKSNVEGRGDLAAIALSDSHQKYTQKKILLAPLKLVEQSQEEMEQNKANLAAVAQENKQLRIEDVALAEAIRAINGKSVSDEPVLDKEGKPQLKKDGSQYTQRDEMELYQQAITRTIQELKTLTQKAEATGDAEDKAKVTVQENILSRLQLDMAITEQRNLVYRAHNLSKQLQEFRKKTEQTFAQVDEKAIGMAGIITSDAQRAELARLEEDARAKALEARRLSAEPNPDPVKALKAEAAFLKAHRELADKKLEAVQAPDRETAMKTYRTQKHTMPKAAEKTRDEKTKAPVMERPIEGDKLEPVQKLKSVQEAAPESKKAAGLVITPAKEQPLILDPKPKNEDTPAPDEITPSAKPAKGWDKALAALEKELKKIHLAGITPQVGMEASDITRAQGLPSGMNNSEKSV